MNAKHDLHNRQEDRWPAVKDRIEAARPPPIITLEDLRASVEKAVEMGLVVVQFTVRRTRPPVRAGAPITLPVMVGGKRRRGPACTTDRAILKCAGPESWSAWWLVSDLATWIKREAVRP